MTQLGVGEEVIEMQRSGRRWAWAVSVPNRTGYPNTGYWAEGFARHPFRNIGTRLGPDAQSYDRVSLGWAWSEKGASKKARNSIQRRRVRLWSRQISDATYTAIGHPLETPPSPPAWAPQPSRPSASQPSERGQFIPGVPLSAFEPNHLPLILTSWQKKQIKRVRLTRAQPGWPGGTDHDVTGWDKFDHPMIARHPTDGRGSIPLLSFEWVAFIDDPIVFDDGPDFDPLHPPIDLLSSPTLKREARP